MLKWFDYLHSEKKTAVLLPEQPNQARVTTQNEILALCYVHFLESLKFANRCEIDFLYGKLLTATSLDLEEPVLIWLMMLKLLYPSGADFQSIDQFKPFEKFSIRSGDLLSDQKMAIQMISRVFSLVEVPISDERYQESLDMPVDYDLAQFCSYMDYVRQVMRYYI